MKIKIKTNLTPLILCLLSFTFIPGVLYSQSESPTVIFYAAYIFEAKMNGDSLEFPLMPGETAIKTLDEVAETTNGYIEKLKSIYAFNHFSLLSTIGGGFTIGLTRNDGQMDTGALYGIKKHFLALSSEAKSPPKDGLLSLRIEAQLDTITKPNQKFPDANRIYLFNTLCTVKDGHPLVIGRPFAYDTKHRSAIFVVFTPFFQQMTHADQYEKVISSFKTVYRLTTGRYKLGGERLIDSVNKYYKTKLNRTGTLDYQTITNSLPPPPPPPSETRDDFPVFVPFDKAPSPIGGYSAVQRNLRYPEIARRAGIEGRILVWVKINKLGTVVQTRIARSLGPNGIDQAAMNAISKTKWNPALRDGKAVAVWISVPVDFRLK